MHFRLLGDFALSLDHTPVAVRSSRLQSLLAYLLLHRDAPQPRQHIAYLFWPDSSEAQAQSNLRNAFAAEKVVYTDNQTFTTNTATLSGIEPSLNYVAAANVTGAADAKAIYVVTANADGTVVLGAKSKSGTCFYMMDSANAPTQYAKDGGCADVATTLTWTSGW